MGVRVWPVTLPLRVPSTLDPQPTAWHQRSGTSSGPGGPASNTLPRRHHPHKEHLMQPCGLNRTWLCGRAQSGSLASVTFILQTPNETCILTGTSVPMRTKGSGLQF